MANQPCEGDGRSQTVALMAETPTQRRGRWGLRDFEARRMVRNLLSTLLEKGRGNAPFSRNSAPNGQAPRGYFGKDSEAGEPGSAAWALKSGPTAPAKGLTLVSVEYP